MWDAICGGGGWSWVLLGVAIVLLGLAAGARGLFGLGIAAIVTGAVAAWLAPAWQLQFALFVVLSAVFLVLPRRLRRRARDPLLLEERLKRFHGHIYPLSEPIIDGTGRMRVDALTWGVAGPDLPGGTLVRVVGHNGKLLTVAAAFGH